MRSGLLLVLLVLVGCSDDLPTDATPGPAPGATSDATLDAALDAVQQAGLCGRLEEATALLAPHLTADADDPRVAVLAGDLATWLAKPEEALGWYRRAAKLDAADPRPHLHAAYVLLTLTGDIAAARAEADAALADTGGVETAAYRACRGEIAWQEGDTALAEERFRAALDLVPECRWALQRLVQIVPPDDPGHAGLRKRLEAALAAERHGEGMSTGRSPVTFCGT